MKKAKILVIAMAFAMAFASTAFAAQGLSVGLGFGLKGDMAGMGATIMDDGLDGAELHSIFGKAVVDEKTLLATEAQTTFIDGIETNGAMTGLDFSFQVRYDFLKMFFAKTGFNYTVQVAGGETTWTYTSDYATALIGGGVPAAAANQITGFKASQTWEASSWGVPLLVGINVPALNGKVNFYAGVGISLSYGKWSLEISDMESQILDDWAASATPFARVNEKVEFSYFGVAPMYAIGVDAEVWNGISIFIEWETVLSAGMSDVKSLSTTQGTAALGTAKLAYPVIAGGQILKVGVSYDIPGI